MTSSLFANIFTAKTKPSKHSSTLFANDSKYKSAPDASVPVEINPLNDTKTKKSTQGTKRKDKEKDEDIPIVVEKNPPKKTAKKAKDAGIVDANGAVEASAATKKVKESAPLPASIIVPKQQKKKAAKIALQDDDNKSIDHPEQKETKKNKKETKNTTIASSKDKVIDKKQAAAAALAAKKAKQEEDKQETNAEEEEEMLKTKTRSKKSSKTKELPDKPTDTTTLKKPRKESIDASKTATTTTNDKDSLNTAITQDALSKTIFIGNLPSTIKKKALSALFTPFGTIQSIRLRSIPIKLDDTTKKLANRRSAVLGGHIDTSRGSAHAYIEFKEKKAVDVALTLNMTSFVGRHIRVDRASTAAKNQLSILNTVQKSTAGTSTASTVVNASTEYDPARSIFIGNLHVETEDEELIRFFIDGLGAGSSTELEAVRVVRDPDSLLGKGIAFVLFKTREGRKAGLSLDGRVFKNRPLRITAVKKDRNTTSGGNSNTKKGDGFLKKNWQGVTATKSGRQRGLDSDRLKKGGMSGGGGGVNKVNLKKEAKKEAKKEGKRPAVAARKAMMKRKKG